jgi:hypothetical protein
MPQTRKNHSPGLLTHLIYADLVFNRIPFDLERPLAERKRIASPGATNQI